MRTRVGEASVVYEIAVNDPAGTYTRKTDGDEVVWRRVVPITKRKHSMADRRQAGQDQERISLLMAAAADPIKAMRRIAQRADWSEREREMEETP